MTLRPAWPDGVRLRHYDILDSTNEEAVRLARAGERGPLWIVAAQQTAGRGRRGRAWVSQPGNLFATLLLEAADPNSAESELSGRDFGRERNPAICAGAIG